MTLRDLLTSGNQSSPDGKHWETPKQPAMPYVVRDMNHTTGGASGHLARSHDAANALHVAQRLASRYRRVGVYFEMVDTGGTTFHEILTFVDGTAVPPQEYYQP